MGRGGGEHGEGDFRSKVWSMSGGPYCRPKQWRHNTAFTLFGIFLVRVPIAVKSAQLEVEAEHAYHQRALQILEQLESERIKAAPSPTLENHAPPPLPPPAYKEVNGGFASQAQNVTTDNMGYFLGELFTIRKRLTGNQLITKYIRKKLMLTMK